MPLPGFVSTDGGKPNTRFGAPVLSGGIADGGASGGPMPPIGGFMCVQSTAALLTQIITTTGQPAKSAFVYIPQGTLAVTSSGTATIAAAPPYTGGGAALYWDYTRSKLSIYSTGNGAAGDWMSITFSSS